MDSRSILLLVLESIIIAFPLPLIWIYKSKKRIMKRQKQVEAEILTQKRMLNEVQEELNQLKEDRVLSVKTDNHQSFKSITGIAYIDIFLFEKQKTCIEKEIDFTCAVAQWPDKDINRKQIIRLLGNLIDNAIEAAEKTEVDNRCVMIESHILKGQWVLIVSNSKSSFEHPLESGMQTTKADAAMHGMGTRIIDKTVKKMGGFVKRIDEGERFKVRITIPVED